MLRSMLALTVAVALGAPAFAQDQPAGPATNPQMQAQRGHMREVCGADIQTFCASAGDDRRARRECMVANQSKFSKPCQDALSEMAARRAAHDADHPHHDAESSPAPGPQ